MTHHDRGDDPGAPSVEKAYQRSPFCLLHWEGDTLCALNCNTFRMFRGADRFLALLLRLNDWLTVHEVAAELAADVGAVRQGLERLEAMDLVISRVPGTAEETPSTHGWNLIDLALQRQSARGGFDRAVSTGAPPPQFKVPPDGQRIDLPHAPLPDVTLQDVFAGRRTLRHHTPQPLTLDELGTFLGSTARVLDVEVDPVVGEFSHRPYPSAGGRHPLEIYPICNAVEGLEAGAYWYNPRDHQLVLLPSDPEGRARVNREVRAAAGELPAQPAPVVVIITAVFARTMWKYDRLGMSLILKDLGGLYQTMYLVAGALGLAPCAIGGGEESANARWLGLDPLIESQVGGFLLGRPAA
jgi:SagB-type dehydrogenase family enzyme